MIDVVTPEEFRTWLRRHGALVGMLAGIGAVLGVVLAAFLPREYRADAVVMLLQDDGSTGGLASQLGGLAALAGVSLGNGNTDEALEVLRSRSLAAKFIAQEDLAKDLFPRRYDAREARWLEDEPTMAEAIDRFERRTRSVSQDKVTGMVRLSMRSRDPATASQWANSFVDLANAEMRERAAREATQMLGYLTAEAAKSPVVEVRQSLYEMAEGQLKTLAMANVRHEFAYRVIDPAMPPDARSYVSPSRVGFAAFGLLLGLLTGLGIAAVRDGRRNSPA